MDPHAEKISFIWSVKELLRDQYKRHQYGEVILPFCVLRRLDCVLEPTRAEVQAKVTQLSGDLDRHADLLSHVAGAPFYNTSRFGFVALLGDPANIGANFLHFLAGFSPNTRDAIDKFGLTRHVERLAAADLLFLVVKRFAEIDLHPDKVSNLEMGSIYEELIRVANEASNEEAGEHFTPREVIRLMVNLLFSGEERLLTPGRIARLYDPACGTGGMLTVAEDHLREINSGARLHLYGQEVQPESYAVCKSDMLIKGHDASRIAFGDTFTHDAFEDERFEYCLANPPYGKDWRAIAKAVKQEHEQRGDAGRFGAGLPPTSDGQVLFLQHMISKLPAPEDGGGRIAVIFNQSPLFSGDAGSGVNSIRRWIIENDWLEAVVGLPDQMFYNTDIFTYIWVLTNRKESARRGYVQLIDGRDLFRKMPKSLGKKRNELTTAHIEAITSAYESFIDSTRSMIVSTMALGYREITVERPSRLRWVISRHAIVQLVESGLVDGEAQESVAAALSTVEGKTFSEHKELEAEISATFPGYGQLRKAGRSHVSDLFAVADVTAPIVRDAKGASLPDRSLKAADKTEHVPLVEDVEEYVDREVRPYEPDAWVDPSRTRIGYEIPFTRAFYEFLPPRALNDIDKDIVEIEDAAVALTQELLP